METRWPIPIREEGLYSFAQRCYGKKYYCDTQSISSDKPFLTPEKRGSA